MLHTVEGGSIVGSISLGPSEGNRNSGAMGFLLGKTSSGSDRGAHSLQRPL